MDYVKSFDLFGTPITQIPCIPQSGAPTTETKAAVGCLYMNTDNGALYKCVAAADGVYTWEQVSTGGYAPADAIVDQSPELEWTGWRDDYDEGRIFEYWKWEKRIDGTFTLRGLKQYLYVERCAPEDLQRGDIFEGGDLLPFDIYDGEFTCSFDIDNVYTDTGESVDATTKAAIADAILVDYFGIDFDDVHVYRDGLLLAVSKTEELLELMINEGIEGFEVTLDIQITGRWREE